MKTIITIPHHSSFIPKELLKDYLLSEKEMNHHIDYATDKIFELKGFDVVKASASRFVVDLNRERDDLGEGQGVIITETWANEKVLNHNLSPAEIEKRLSLYYDPFYVQLDFLLEKTSKPLFVLDGHSMDSKGSSVAGDKGSERPEICFATGRETISPELLKIFEEEFSKEGFEWAANNPYAGLRAKIIHRAKAIDGVEALELEVNKKVYMAEKTFELKKGNIELLRATITRCLNRIGEK